ncbi:MAG: hypothetical protein ACLGPL_09355, partial [Acidobacteriota bacterium]
GTKIIANHIMSLDDAQTQTVDSVRIRLPAQGLDRDGLTRLRHLLVSHSGECKTFLHLAVEDQGEAVIALSKLPITPTRNFFRDMAQHFGPESTEPVYKVCFTEEQPASNGRFQRRQSQ